jgi:hypothetical protein
MGTFLLVAALPAATPARAASYYPEKPEDPGAVTVTAKDFGVHADGVGDDTAALQGAIDRVQETTRRGIVLVPSGRYRLTAALHVWSGIRLIGFGADRPVLVLGEDTPGYQDGDGKYLVQFASDRPSSPAQAVRDANPGTFYSAMSNIDIEIRDGNAAAVGIRSHYAQHCYLAHIDFRTGGGRAGVEEVGNESYDLHFHGGEFGIRMHKTSPSWPFLLMDSTFEGQRKAAIETEEGGLTLVRVRLGDVPTAILVRENRAEELSMKDCRLERVSGPAVVIGDEKSARTQISLRDMICVGVPTLASFRESGAVVAGGGPIYRVKDFSYGLRYSDVGAVPAIGMAVDIEPLAVAPAPAPSDIAELPAMDTWSNVRALGAKGDGVTDDTAALRSAIAAHRAVYLPSGRYRVTDTIELRPDTVLIGLDPITTQILITDFTPAFQGVNGPTERPQPPSIPGVPRSFLTPQPFAGRGSPVPMVEAPAGGTNIITGIGLDTGGVNNRAVALKWLAGANSLVDDVRFLGGHGTYGPDGQWLQIYNDNRTADPDPLRKWDSEYWSLWVTDGGGGAFRGIWTPSPFAAAGIYVSNTSTPGRIYALSSEHHVRNEVKLRNVSHWQISALQTEEERGESPHALPLEIEGCGDLAVSNYFIYRVDIPVPFETGIRVTDSSDLLFRGLHVYSPGKLSFDNTLIDATRGVEIRSREIASLGVSGAPPPAHRATKVERLAGGFTNIDGSAADAAGNVYFVDQAWSRIFRWGARGGLSLVTDSIPQPVALAVDTAGDLIVVSRHGNIYAMKPGAGEGQIAVLEPATSAPPPGAVEWLPTNRWRDAHDWKSANEQTGLLNYVSPDRSAFISAPVAYSNLAKPGGGRGGTIDLARTYELAPAMPGGTLYVSDEFAQKTWSVRVEPGGTRGPAELFAEEGEAGTTVDSAGNVYVCAGNVFVYDRSGKQVGLIEVPERPSAIVFGGPEGRTLFIAARTSLYSAAGFGP